MNAKRKNCRLPLSYRRRSTEIGGKGGDPPMETPTDFPRGYTPCPISTPTCPQGLAYPMEVNKRQLIYLLFSPPIVSFFAPHNRETNEGNETIGG